MIVQLRYLTSVAILIAGAAPGVAATSLSGSMNLTVSASMRDGTKTASTTSSDSFTGAPAVMGIFAVASATDGDTGGILTAIGQGIASGTADSGSIHFQNYGWTLTAPDRLDAGQSVRLNTGTPDWSYTFMADHAGSFTLDYNVFLSAGSGDAFGLQGWGIGWSGPGGGDFPGTAFDPTASGTFTRALVGGETYTVSLSNNANIMTTSSFNPAAGFEASRMNGDFVYTIIESAVPEPASWAMMLGGFGLVGGALRRRARNSATLIA
jgi:hypothetical protein